MMAASAKKAMVKKMSRVGVVSMGVNLGALYAILGAIYAIAWVGIMLVVGMFTVDKGDSSIGLAGIGVVSGIMLVAMPIIFAIIGFTAGAVTAIVYNFVAKYTGGIVFEMTD